MINTLINFILESLLLGGVESILIMLVVFNFDLKYLAKGKLFLCWLSMSFALRLCVMITFGTPIMSHFLMIFVALWIINNMFEIDLKLSIIKCIALIFIIALISECTIFVLLCNFKGIVIYSNMSLISKFLNVVIWVKLLEVVLAFICHKKDVLAKLSEGTCIIMGLFWFFGREENKEVEEKEEEVTEE